MSLTGFPFASNPYSFIAACVAGPIIPSALIFAPRPINLFCKVITGFGAVGFAACPDGGLAGVGAAATGAKGVGSIFVGSATGVATATGSATGAAGAAGSVAGNPICFALA